MVEINKKSVRKKSVNVLFFSCNTEKQLPCKCHCAATLVLPQYIQGMLVEGPVRKIRKVSRRPSEEGNCHVRTGLIAFSHSGFLGPFLAAESKAEWNTELTQKTMSMF